MICLWTLPKCKGSPTRQALWEVKELINNMVVCNIVEVPTKEEEAVEAKDVEAEVVTCNLLNIWLNPINSSNNNNLCPNLNLASPILNRWPRICPDHNSNSSSHLWCKLDHRCNSNYTSRLLSTIKVLSIALRTWTRRNNTLVIASILRLILLSALHSLERSQACSSTKMQSTLKDFSRIKLIWMTKLWRHTNFSSKLKLKPHKPWPTPNER